MHGANSEISFMMFKEFATFGQYCLTSPVFCCNTIGVEFAALPAGQAAYNQVVNNFPDRGRTAGSGATPALYLWGRCSLQGAGKQLDSQGRHDEAP
jgi:hypothetical protein